MSADVDRFSSDLAARTGVSEADVKKVLVELGIDKTVNNFHRIFSASEAETLGAGNLSVSIGFAKTMIHK